MITPGQIREKKLSTVESNGYDRNEVNELLVEILDSYEAVYNENKELYRKMEILANRIEEYRADEDSIKSAIIAAEKMAIQVKAEARAEAEKTVSESAAAAHQTVLDAQTKADKIIGDARDYVANLTQEKESAAGALVAEAEERANKAISSAKVVAQNVLEQAKNTSKEIVERAKQETEAHKELAARLKSESRGFRESLISLYESQLTRLKDLAVDDSSADKDLENLEANLNTLFANFSDLEAVEQEAAETTEEPAVEDIEEPFEPDEDITEDTIEEPEEIDDEIEEILDEPEDQDDEPVVDPVDEIIEEIEEIDLNSFINNTPEEEPVTEADVESAIDAFSSNEITPINGASSAIPEIDEDTELEEPMPFESYFNVNKRDAHNTDEVISLIPPEDDEDDEDDNPKFKGFFKKRK